jgi:hypothetical protein
VSNTRPVSARQTLASEAADFEAGDCVVNIAWWNIREWKPVVSGVDVNARQ